MASHMYGYEAASSRPSATTTTFSTHYTAHALAEPYHPEPLPLHLRSDLSKLSFAAAPSTMYLSSADGLGAYPSASRTATHLASQASWLTSADAAAAAESVAAGIKRSTEALYHQTVLGAHSTIGQSEAWYSTDALTKRLRYESASNLPIYPQRPGEKDCAHYMITRNCKFGDSCKFDHPIWVPEGGIPDWKEVPPVPSEVLPERPGELDCPYFLKTQKCKYGLRCKFNHPKDKLAAADSSEDDVSVLPERPSEPPCAFYLKTGKCKFGATCKFNHPKDIQLPLAGQENGSSEYQAVKTTADANPYVSYTPAMLYNSKELPIRPGEPDCPFYLKTGSCKYGVTCRYSHPDRTALYSPAAAINPTIVASPATGLNIGVVNPVASLYQTIDPVFARSMVGVAPSTYPQRTGQIECDYYMKTGECRFGERCRFHHPIDRSAPTLATLQAQQQSIKLTLAGLPRREGAIICPYYLKTGTCKYGATCKFDHPPPGEVMALASTQGTDGSAAAEEANGDEKETQNNQEQAQ
ncbi:hypothetical protein UlMin_024018 [Ulmus minor]